MLGETNGRSANNPVGRGAKRRFSEAERSEQRPAEDMEDVFLDPKTDRRMTVLAALILIAMILGFITLAVAVVGYVW